MGKLCTGENYNSSGVPRLRESKAYCEGLDHRISTNGASFGDNPHVAGSPDGDAWDRGWSVGQSDVGEILTAGAAPCCAPDRNATIVP